VVTSRFAKTALLLPLAAGLALSQDTANPQIQAIQDFENRLNDYVNLQKNLAKGLSATKPTNDPELILDRQRHLARKIREARNHAQQGDIFTPAIAKEFLRLLTLAMAGPNRADITKSLARSEPVRLPLHVNEAYPANVPLQSTPPTILMNLPRLPPEVEYRIASHALVLRDAVANVVVDLIPNAIP
jgi:hypothetical protein